VLVVVLGMSAAVIMLAVNKLLTVYRLRLRRLTQ
jgi:hypothetical protein